MKIVDSAIRFPVTTAVGVILVVMFGLISFYRIPIQLTPTVDEPEIMVRTIWPGASPEEVEREIVEEQEEQLKGLEGLRELESQSQDSRGTVQPYLSNRHRYGYGAPEGLQLPRTGAAIP